ncbi:MAG: RNA methyltransferase [Bdellovibrionales bacterium]|nr:RNA methyltransferase [Bdellovibrionales bacterium]
MKTKDAIADQFTEKFGKRPNVDKEEPDVRVHIFGSKNEFRVSVDTTGRSLSARGYRKAGVEAPMREHLAAGLIQMTGWDMKSPLVDPMCGSGTLLIEAAMMLKNIVPGTFHKKFSFQGFEHIDDRLFENELDTVIGEEKEEEFPFKLYGFDKSFDSIRAARRNAEMAGVDDLIEFEKGDARDLAPPVEKGMIVTNPPHGIRLGDEFFLEELYKEFAYNLKKSFSGWQMWLLSGEAKWTRHLKMKAEKKFPVDNGGVDSRWMHYRIREF